MTDETTSPAAPQDNIEPTTAPAPEPTKAPEATPVAEPSPAPAAEPSLLDEIMQDLHAVIAKVENLEHEAAAEIKAGVESLIARFKQA